jgi:uncharacterized protein (DUF305 family)
MRTLIFLGVLTAFAVSCAHVAAGASPAPKPSPRATATPNPTLSALSKLTGRDLDIAALRELLPRFEEDVEIAYAATLNADHPALLQWNQRMIERKSQQTKQMLAMLADMQVPPGRRGVSVVTPEVKQMRQLKSAPLERRYLILMVQRFEHNLTVAGLIAQKGLRPDLQALARDITRVERQEILMLKNWFNEWYGR